MANTIESRVASICERFKSAAQSALDSMGYAIEDLEYIAEANPDREDIKACLAELKSTNKANENTNWVTANKWAEHFDGINPVTEEGGEKKPAAATEK